MDESSGVETPIQILSDPSLEWMRQYSAMVDDERWSMSLFAIDTDAIIQLLVRNVDPAKAAQSIMGTVQSMQKDPQV